MPHYNAGALVALDRVVAIAHRGGSRLRPENTLAAFDHALSLDVDGLECDVRLSSDGEVVVIHDDSLDRTTDATGAVSARTAAELARVDAGFRFGEDDGFPFRGRQIGIPRLAEVLTRHPEVPVIVEIKGDDADVGRRALAVVRECRAGSRVVLAGFSQIVLDDVRRLAPDILTSASRLEAQSAFARSRMWLPLKRTPARVFQVPFRLKGRELFGRRFVHSARRAGLPVQVWVTDDPADMARLVSMGVTGLISDRPDIAVAVAAETRRARSGEHVKPAADDGLVAKGSRT